MPSTTPNVKKRNWLFIVLPIVAMVFSLAPWMYGRLILPAGSTYFGSFFRASGDTAVYYRYINEGRHGGPFMGDGFTTESLQPILWQPLWWFLGRIAEVSHASTPLIYALARVVSAGLAGLVIAWAATLLFADRATRAIASWLAYFGAGIGGLVAFIVPSWPPGHVAPPYDIWVSEGFPWLSSLASPHFLFVTAGLLFVLVGSEYGWGKKWVRLIAGPVLLLVLSIHPFHIITLAIIFIGLTGYDLIVPGRPIWKNLRRRLGIAAWAIPVGVYYLGTIHNPIVAGRAEQNVNPTYGWEFFLGIALFASALLVSFFRKDKHWSVLMLFWAGALVLDAFLPISFARRLAQGLTIPFAFLIAPAVASWWRDRVYTRLLLVLFAAVMMLSPIEVLVREFSTISYDAHNTTQFYSYVSPSYQRIIVALVDHPNWSPVLTGRMNGDLVAGTTMARVYLGHLVETLDSRRKIKEVQAFFASYAPEQQKAFVEKNHLCSILVSPAERDMANGRPLTFWPGVQVAVVAGDLTLYTTGACH